MSESTSITEREIKIVQVLRPLGRGPLTNAQARLAAQLLGVHWTTVYRLRRRFLRDPVTSALVPNAPGRLKEPQRLLPSVEEVIGEVVEQWMPRQRELAHPVLDAHLEVRRRCIKQGLIAPSRNTVSRRIKAHHDAGLARLAMIRTRRPRLAASSPPPHWRSRCSASSVADGRR